MSIDVPVPSGPECSWSERFHAPALQQGLRWSQVCRFSRNPALILSTTRGPDESAPSCQDCFNCRCRPVATRFRAGCRSFFRLGGGHCHFVDFVDFHHVHPRAQGSTDKLHTRESRTQCELRDSYFHSACLCGFGDVRVSDPTILWILLGALMYVKSYHEGVP